MTEKPKYDHEINIRDFKETDFVKNIRSMQHEVVEAQLKQMNANPDELLTIKYLREIHVGLSEIDAVELLEFCRQNTIYHNGCYGNGEIIIPLWMRSRDQSQVK